MRMWKAWALIFSTLAWGSAWAAPGVINYQGRLTDASGKPVITPVNVTFTFWDAKTGGVQLGDGFSDTDAVSPDADGVYSTLIGDDPGNLIPLSVFNGNSVWLNVNMGGDDLVPRLRITPVGFAFQASQACSATTATHAFMADSATNAVEAAHADTATTAATAETLGGLGVSDFLARTGESYVVVKTTVSPAQNGANLLAAYASAKTLTPGGSALSATNRVAVLVPPGSYDLGSSSIMLDTDYVDLVGLSAARDDQYIHGTSQVAIQTASGLRIQNLVLDYTGSDNLTYAYAPSATWNDGTSHRGSPPQTAIRNCEFRGANEGMSPGTEYAGNYEDCTCGGGNAFGGFGGIASGTFINCTGGVDAFGAVSGMASGVFINCVGGDYAFGGAFGLATGVFTNCVGGLAAFGGNGGTASGSFTGCTGGDGAFGGSGSARGTFTNCTGGDSAFGYQGQADGGKFYHCVGGVNAFTESGTPSPVQLFCIQNGAQYPGNN